MQVLEKNVWYASFGDLTLTTGYKVTELKLVSAQNLMRVSEHAHSDFNQPGLTFNLHGIQPAFELNTFCLPSEFIKQFSDMWIVDVAISEHKGGGGLRRYPAIDPVHSKPSTHFFFFRALK